MNESLIFSEADTRNEKAPLTVRSYEDEEVRIIGGKSIDATKFTKVTDGKILQRLPVESRGKVYCLNMDEQGEFYYGAFVQYGTYHLDTSTILDIYVNGQRVNNARWPNEGYAKVDGVVVKNVIIISVAVRKGDYIDFGSFGSGSFGFIRFLFRRFFVGRIKVFDFYKIKLAFCFIGNCGFL